MNRRNPAIRKAASLFKQIPRLTARLTRSSAPAVLANSFPKSGTHLLVQMLESLPGIRNWDSFIASIPPITYRLRSHRTIHRRISWIAPSELVSAHLHYHESYRVSLQKRSCVSFFILRDLRDVAVSEAHYLTYMNRYHRLHRLFASLPDDASRVLMAITGLPKEATAYNYPSIAERFCPYRQWLLEEDTCVVRFEDLVSPRRDETALRLAEWFRQRSSALIGPATDIAQRMLSAIDPQRSRTFRSGSPGAWTSVFDERHRSAFTTPMRELLIETGHESRADW